MAVPRNRLSNARKNIRRSHHAKTLKSGTQCTNCGSKKLSQRICGSCGAYGKRIIVQKEQAE